MVVSSKTALIRSFLLFIQRPALFSFIQNKLHQLIWIVIRRPQVGECIQIINRRNLLLLDQPRKRKRILFMVDCGVFTILLAHETSPSRLAA